MIIQMCKTSKEQVISMLSVGYILVRHIMFVCLMVLNATFKNISVISWRSVLVMEEIGVPKENNQPVSSH